MIQLAFALQVQALTTEDSGDWSMLRFEEKLDFYISVVKAYIFVKNESKFRQKMEKKVK